MSPPPDRSPAEPPELSSKSAAEAQRWERETRAPCVAAHPERREPFLTQALKWPIQPLYTPADLEAAGFDYLKDLGFPGEYPFTRGTQPNGHRSDLWTMSQVTGFGKGEDWAKRARYMLDQGLQGLILEHDLPTTNGYDSDHPLVEGEVGRAGMALDSLEDLERAFELPFEKLRYLMSVCNAPQPVNLAMIIAALEKKGVDPRGFVLHRQRHTDRVHLRRSLHLPAGARPAHRHRLHRIHHPPPSELGADLDHQRAAAAGQGEPGAGDRLLDGDRHGLPRRDAGSRAGHRHGGTLFPLRHQCRHGLL